MLTESSQVETITFLHWEMPRWAYMWGIAVAMFAFLKGLTLRWARADATLARKAAYLLLWPGMDANRFLSGISPAPERGEWLAAATKTIIGVFLVALSQRLSHPLAGGWVAMIGIVLLLHFGLFHLLSCFWRSQGVDAPRLMNRPLLASSISAFWSRHWNVAFRDITHRLVFLPLRHSIGPGAAVFCGFLFSGLLHELVITVPAGGGYGGPTLFFALQGLALLAERTQPAHRIGLGKGFKGWLFVQTLLIVSAPLLFPPAFVIRVINPFIQFLHGLAP